MTETQLAVRRGSSRRVRGFIVLALLLIIAVAGRSIFRSLTDSRERPESASGDVLYVEQSPVRLPANEPLPAATLGETDEVIGVEVGTHHRAYAIRALELLDYHVVNDQFDELHLAVTYCDRSGCARVLTAPGGPAPDVSVGGWDGRPGGGMLLRIGEDLYDQRTGRPFHVASASPFPYTDRHFERTTWGQWREAHPDTDLFAGELPESAGDDGEAP